MTLIKLRLDLLFTDLSQHFGMYLVVFALKFFIHRHGVRGGMEQLCRIIKTHTTTTTI